MATRSIKKKRIKKKRIRKVENAESKLDGYLSSPSPSYPSLSGAENILELLKKEIKRVEFNLQEVEDFYKKELRWFDHLSDAIARIGGSWTFIISFIAVLLSWVVINAFILIAPFDRYPFIMLNLLLSCVAALQGPIILMSQNRAAKRDQTRIELDLEKDVRDLKVDEASHALLLQIHHDVMRIKKKIGID